MAPASTVYPTFQRFYYASLYSSATSQQWLPPSSNLFSRSSSSMASTVFPRSIKHPKSSIKEDNDSNLVTVMSEKPGTGLPRFSFRLISSQVDIVEEDHDGNEKDEEIRNEIEVDEKEKQQEMDWKTDEEFKKFMGRPSIEAAIKLEKKRANRKLKELDRETEVHSRVIWLGDLNYRIALNYSETRKLMAENKWDALLNKDQEVRTGNSYDIVEDKFCLKVAGDDVPPSPLTPQGGLSLASSSGSVVFENGSSPSPSKVYRNPEGRLAEVKEDLSASEGKSTMCPPPELLIHKDAN